MARLSKLARSNTLVATAVLSGALYGMAAALTLLHWEDISPFERFGLGVLSTAILYGLALGVVSCVYVLPLLWQTDLRRSVPVVISLTVAATISIPTLVQDLSSVVWACISLGINLAACGLAFALFRAKSALVPNACEKCGYSLQGLPQGQCPECGRFFATP